MPMVLRHLSSTIVPVHQSAAFAFKHLCRSLRNREILQSLNGVRTLVPLLGTNSPVKDVTSRVQIAEVMSVLSFAESHRRTLKEIGGIPVVIDLLQGLSYHSFCLVFSSFFYSF
jgi:hypothetical protein